MRLSNESVEIGETFLNRMGKSVEGVGNDQVLSNFCFLTRHYYTVDQDDTNLASVHLFYFRRGLSHVPRVFETEAYQIVAFL